MFNNNDNNINSAIGGVQNTVDAWDEHTEMTPLKKY